MRRLAALVSLLVLPCLAPAAASAASVLNEVRVDPGMMDQPYEYVELRGVANASLAGEYLVLLEGDGSPGAGTADMVVNFATACGGSACSFGTNELLFVGATTLNYTIPAPTTNVGDAQFNTGAIENGTTSVLLVSATTAPVEGTDYDANDDGVLAFPGGTTVLDGIAFSEGGVSDLTYASVLTGAGSPPDAATRFPDDSTASSAAAWYFGASEPSSQTSLAYVAPLSANFPLGGVLTPGAHNVGDIDDDGVADGSDNCPSVANANQANTDGAGDGGDACDGDDDNDGVADGSDNCPLNVNADQANTDGAGDGGDACDGDDDNDGVSDSADACPLTAAATANGCPPGAAPDADGDGVGDSSDNCPSVANAGQENLDGDADGNACDADDDNDGVSDSADACPTVAAATATGCPGGATGTDVTPPPLKLSGKRKQVAGRKVAVKVRAAAEARRVGAKAKVKIGSKTVKLKRVAPRELAAGAALKLRVAIRERTLTKIKAALDQGKRVVVRITVTAADAAGNVASAVRKVRLR